MLLQTPDYVAIVNEMIHDRSHRPDERATACGVGC
jgi:hypothetical protein